MVNYLKLFKICVLHSKIIAYVPSVAVKEILVHPDSEGKIGHWNKIMAYDVEIKPKKLVKGQGLAKLLSDSNY